MKTVAKNRENTYGFLSVIFRKELTEDQIKGMLESGIFNLLIEAGCNIDLALLTEKPLKEIEEEFACEYTALFLGPGKHVYPFESAYVHYGTGSIGSYRGNCTVNMKNWVDRYGLKFSSEFESVPDHISIELEFMQKVIEQERAFLEKDDAVHAERYREIERAFFVEHINKWVPEFCEKVKESATLEFYREIARITKAFLQEEERLLVNSKGNRNPSPVSYHLIPQM